MHKTIYYSVRKAFVLLLCTATALSCSAQNFTPVDLPNLLVWLKADSLVTLSGSNVSLWGDGAGPTNDSVSQGSALLQPVYVPDAGPLMNNKPAILFDGSDDVLTGGAVTGINDGSLSIFIVADNSGQPTNTPGFLHIGSNQGFYMYRNATGILVTYNSNASANSAAGLVPQAGHPFRIYEAVKNLSTNLTVYVNGQQVAISTAADGVFTNGAFRVGRITTSNSVWKGHISEVVAYRGALTPAERIMVENYLYDKYAPPVSLGPDVVQTYSLCPVVLNASKRFVNYLWSDGSTADTLRVTQNGTYWVRTTDVFGRISSDTINVTVPQAALLQNDTTVCFGNNINISTTLSAGNYNFLWSNNATTPTITTAVAGTYYAVITEVGQACSLTTDSIILAVDSLGAIVSLGADTTLCSGNSIGLLSPATGWGNLTFNWQPGNVTTPLYTVNTSGAYSVQVTNSQGCVGRDTINVSIAGNAPVVAFTIDTLCLGQAYLPVNTSASTDASPITSYLWNFGDGNSAAVQSPQHFYQSAGIYPVSLTVTTSAGCSNTLVRQVTVRDNPIAAFTVPAVGCIQNPLQFTNTSTAAPGSTITQSQWQFDDGGTSTQTSPQHTYTVAGNYMPQLIIADNFGCNDTSQATVQIVSSAPAPLIPSLTTPANNASLVNGSNVVFNWSGSADSYVLLLSTDSAFGNSTAYTTTATTYTVASLPGNNTYYWKVKAYNVCNDSAESTRWKFNIFSPSDISNLLVWLKADSLVTHTGNNVRLWGDGAGATNDSVATATVTQQPLYIPDAGPLVNYKPSVRFDGIDDILTGGTVQGINDTSLSIFVLTDNSGPSSGSPAMIHIGGNTSFYMYRSTSQQYVVSNGNGAAASAPGVIPVSGHPFRIYEAVKSFGSSLRLYINGDSVGTGNAHGTFLNGVFRLGRGASGLGPWQGNISEVIIYRRALDAAQRNAVEKYLYDKYAPPVNLGPDVVQAYSLCPVTADASLRFVSYVWNTGDTTSQITVKQSGTYYVRVVDVFGRTSSDTINITLPYSGLNFTDTTLCKGSEAVIQPILTNSPYTFDWNTGDNTSTLQVTQPGAYVVTITDTTTPAGCFIVTDTVFVAVDSFTEISLLPADTATCIGNLLQVNTAGYVLSSIEWSTGADTTYITVAAAGTYSVTATDVNQCVVADTINISIKGIAPTVNFSATDVCLGNATVFADLSSTTAPDVISDWDWDFGDATTATGSNVTHTYTEYGSYPVMLTVTTDSGCVGSTVKNAEVYGLPSANFIQTAPICASTPGKLSSTSIAPPGVSIGQYRWLYNNALIATSAEPMLTLTQQGLLPVTLIVTTSQGCSDTVTRNVEVFPPVLADFEVSNVCVGDSSYFFDVTPGNSIVSRLWTFGDGPVPSTVKNPVHKYNAPNSYTVTLKVTNAVGCVDTAVKTVIAASKPVAAFGNLVGCEDVFYTPLDSSTSAAGDPIQRWQWNIGGFNYNAQAPTRYFATPGAYPVKLVVTTATGCSDSVSKTATIYPRPVAQFSFVPLYGDAPLEVTFTNQSTGAVNYFWSFGDGGTSTEVNPVYNYTYNDTFSVSLQAISQYGCSAYRNRPYTVIATNLDFVVNEADVIVTPLTDGSSLAQVNFRGSNIGTRIIEQVGFYVSMGGVGVLAEDWNGTLFTGQILTDTFSAKFVVPAGQGESYICVTAVSVNNGQTELRTDNNSQCFTITEGIQLMGPLPNPALTQSVLGLILPKSGIVTLDIADMMGRYVVRGVELDLPEGRSDYNLPIGQMVAGEYFIRISYNDEKVVRKFIISR